MIQGELSQSADTWIQIKVLQTVVDTAGWNLRMCVQKHLDFTVFGLSEIVITNPEWAH